MIVFLGLNGVGKSIMLKVISGFLKVECGCISCGEIKFEGMDIIEMFV